MFNRNFSVFCLLAIFASRSPPSRADVSPESIQSRLLGASNAPTSSISRNSVASVRLRNLQMSVHVCGGFIINKHWVGTAAQCLTGKTVKNTVVAVERPRITGGVIHEINQVVKHPNYNTLSLANDVGLLRTLTEIIFTEAVQPIPLGTAVSTNFNANMYGWGLTAANGGFSETLRMQAFGSVNHADCLTRFPVVTRRFITERQICFSSSRGSTCPGDAGGPIVFNNTVVGIISWAEPCVAGVTSVHTRISTYMNWIVSFTRQDD